MCGIFGCISIKPRKLNKGLFNTLGINNDSRGGDSCGIFIDGEVEYGVNQNKLYYDFFTDSELLNKTNHCSIALGHCRKASVGGVKPELAHPICIRNNKTNNIDFVLIHNGTIDNYKELAKKYIPNYDITNWSDSQVLARIIYNTGFKVFNEYIGAIATVFVDYRGESPRIFFWKGASKKTSAGKPEKERPLYGYFQNKTFWFSSIPNYLEAYYPEHGAVWEVGDNIVYEFVEDGFVTIQEYPEHANSIRVTTTTYCGYSSNSYYGYYPSTNSFYSRGGTSYPKEEEIWDEDDVYVNTRNISVDTNYQINPYLGRIALVPGTMINKGFVSFEFSGIGKDIKSLDQIQDFYITSFGSIYEHEPSIQHSIKASYYNGILFPTIQDAKAAEELSLDLKYSDNTPEQRDELFNLIIESSLYPLVYKEGFLYIVENGVYKLFTGELYNIATATVYKYKDGKEISKSANVILQSWNSNKLIKVEG